MVQFSHNVFLGDSQMFPFSLTTIPFQTRYGRGIKIILEFISILILLHFSSPTCPI